MVAGIDKFREFFEGHEDEYVIIGGAACELIFGEAGLPFRATKDIDLVLCVEVVSADFGQRIQAFLEAGRYTAREKSGQREFYRFHKPADASFPAMIELFAREPAALTLPNDAEIARIPVEEDVVSLSAILLEPHYFDALQRSKRTIDGVSILDERLLIPFKAHAFVDLSQRRAEGKEVKGADIKKHRNDVFRLLQLLGTDETVEVSETIRVDIRAFIALVENDVAFDPSAFKVRFSREEGIAMLRSVYGIA